MHMGRSLERDCICGAWEILLGFIMWRGDFLTLLGSLSALILVLVHTTNWSFLLEFLTLPRLSC
jgi:hypothetical protein